MARKSKDGAELQIIEFILQVGKGDEMLISKLLPKILFFFPQVSNATKSASPVVPDSVLDTIKDEVKNISEAVGSLEQQVIGEIVT